MDNMKKMCSGFVHWTTSERYLFYCAVSVIVLTDLVSCKSLSGQTTTCTNEGESVDVPLVASDPCYRCFCKRGRVECDSFQCPSLDGCHAVLFNRPTQSCCGVCKGCSFNGTVKASGSVWSSLDDPCEIRMCKAGVLTSSREICKPPCQNPIPVDGQCCPVCKGCYFDGRQRKNGEMFESRQDPNITCTCQGGNVMCSQRACPVLNCPKKFVEHTQGERCPRCKGQRKIFDIQESCYFSKGVYNNGDVVDVDGCTSCVCLLGTMKCERLQCPVVDCPTREQVIVPGACCPTCHKFKTCTSKSKIIQHGATIQEAECESCTCNDGQIECRMKQCKNPVSKCPLGSSLSYGTDRCCPVCLKDDAKCLVRGAASDRIITFDQRKYETDAFCTHDVVRDCGQGRFSVKAEYRKIKSGQRQIKLLSISFGSTRIKLYRSLKISINRTSIYSQNLEHGLFGIRIDPPRVHVKAKLLKFKLTWDMDDLLSVKVSGEMYQSQGLCGLCGNFNGKTEDDLSSRDGKIVKNPSDMARAWIRGDRCRRRVSGTNTGGTVTSRQQNHDYDDENSYRDIGIYSDNEVSIIDLLKSSNSRVSGEKQEPKIQPLASSSDFVENSHNNADYLTSLLESPDTAKGNSNLQIDRKARRGEKMKDVGNIENNFNTRGDLNSQGKCSENSSVEWIRARKQCQLLRDHKLQHCKAVLDAGSFTQSCAMNMCKCQDNESCEENTTIAYVTLCDLRSGKTAKSKGKS